MPKRFETKEEYNKWMREYRLKNIEKFRAYQREYNSLYRRKNGYKSEKKWKKKNRLKIRVEQVLHRAIEAGLLKRKPCEICGNEKSVAHHPSYDRPLEVVFLCHIHHRKYHYRTIKVIHSGVIDTKTKQA